MESPEKIKESLLENLGERVKLDFPLAPLTSFKIGGPADFFFEARNPAELIKAISLGQAAGIDRFVLGGGYNVLVSDRGFRGLVIKNSCLGFVAEGEEVGAQSGSSLNEVVDRIAELGLSGLEFLAGIPGTVGGAVCGNAGAFGKSIGELLDKAVIFNSESGLKTVNNDYFGFDYRTSKLKSSKEVLISASFHLEERSPQEVKKKAEEIRALRRQRHPEDEASVGCFFKNIRKRDQTIPAGKLLEEVGAKEMRVGKAAVFGKHANIIINTGGGKASEVRQLAEMMKQRVKERFGYLLEPEVVFLGEEPEAR